MSELLQTVAAYVPPSLARTALNDAAPKPPTHPQTERFLAAALFADVSGFTPLTEALGQKGSEGPEELTRLLNRYFSWMIAFVEAEGGEVIKFGGDALTVIFPAKDEALGHATRRALQAAETMQMAMQEFGIMESSVGLVTLHMKIGIGAGEIIWAQVGGIDDRWEYIIAGDVLKQSAQAEKKANQGEIVLSPEAQAVITAHPLPRKPLPLLNWTSVHNEDAVAAALLCYTPKPVRTWLEEGLHSWLATLRPMSVLFVNINGVDYEHPDAIEKLHAFLRRAQEIIYQYQGSLPRLTVDDKGTVMLILFGAPPYSHEDDAERALRCALDLQNLAQKHNLQLAVGVTTGRVFAGPVGGTTRREYTVMGDTVNLAARLMVAIGPGNVCCNYNTYRSAYRQMSFKSLPPVTVKGKTGPVTIYQPTGNYHPRWQLDKINRPNITGPLIGRQAELTKLMANLDAAERGQCRVILIEGEAGIGKSKLLESLIRLMQTRHIPMLLGMGRSIEQDIPYRAWQDILGAYFDMHGITPAETGRQSQQTMPDSMQFIALLNNILLPDAETKASPDTSTRQKNPITMLLTLLEAETAKQPLAIIFEDAQWLDSTSWELVVRAAQHMNQKGLPLILVLVMRPLEGTSQTAAKILTRMDNTEQLRLDSLSPEETVTLAVQGMGLTANELPEAVADLMHVRAGGNPFFAEELFYFLYNNGYITFKTINDKTRCLISGDLDKAAQTLPATIQNIILARIDQLPPEKQLMLKIAAVIGQTFSYSILHDTLARHMESSHHQFEQDLYDLVYLGLIQPEISDDQLAYRFRHIIIREVTYQSLLFDRRRQLHRTVALWYESTIEPPNQEQQSVEQSIYLPLQLQLASSPEQTSLYSLLVYHWHQAEDDERERHYATLLGEQAVFQCANAEAVGYINRALDLTSKDDLQERYRLLLARELVYDRRGERDVQHQDLTALADVVEQIESHPQKIVVALRQAHYAEATGNYAAALDAAKWAVNQAEEAKDMAGQGKGYIMWGKVLTYQGQCQEAHKTLEQALALTRSCGSLYDEADALNSLAYLHWCQGNYALATQHVQTALDLSNTHHFPVISAHALYIAGLVKYQLAEFQPARQSFEQAISIYYAIEDRRAELKPFFNIGLIHLGTGHYETARDYFEYTLDISREINNQESVADALCALGVLYSKLGAYTTARSYLGQALGLYKEIKHIIGESNALSKFGLVYYGMNNFGTTKRYCELALAIQQKNGDRKNQCYTLTYLGHALTEQNQLDEAAEAYQTALQLYEDMNHPMPNLDALAGLAYINTLQDNTEQAATQAKEIAGWINTHGLDGIDNPFWVYLKIYQVFEAAALKKPAYLERAETALNAAYSMLQSQAASLDNKNLQNNFLNKVKAHHEIAALWEKKHPAPQKRRQNADQTGKLFTILDNNETA